MGHSVGDGYIVAALAAAFIAWMYFRHVERQRRQEIVHQERLVAIEKGMPLPELPLDPPRVPQAPNPKALLVHGLAWTALGLGSMLALGITGLRMNGLSLWPLPLPLALLGIGLVLYYALASDRTR